MLSEIEIIPTREAVTLIQTFGDIATLIISYEGSSGIVIELARVIEKNAHHFVLANTPLMMIKKDVK